MKLIALLLMMPIFSFSNPKNNNFATGLVTPETLVSGINIKTVSSMLAPKSIKLTDGKVSHNLKANTLNVNNITLKEAIVVSDKGIITSLSLTFTKLNGEKFLSGIIKKHGMPFGEMIDVYEWRNNNVIFEIHPTSAGYTATYKPLDSEVSIAVN